MKNSRGALALVIGVAAAVGCSGGGGGNGGSFASTAPATSGTSTVTSGSTTTTGGPGTSGVTTSSITVSSTVTIDAFAALREKSSAADMVVASDPVNKNKLFVLEDQGSVRVIDLSAAKPALDRAIALDSSPLPTGTVMGSLSISNDGKIACATASGGGAELVYVFDPSQAKTPADVTRLDFSQVKLTLNQAMPSSTGTQVTTFSPTYTAHALFASGKLFVAFSNIDSKMNYNPGTVLIFDFDVAKRVVSNGRLDVTTQFNPTRLALWTGPKGEQAVLVTDSSILPAAGGAAVGTPAVDVIDVAGTKLVATIPIGTGNAAGSVAITPDGKSGFVGSSSAAQVSQLDLSGLEIFLPNTTPVSLNRNTGTIALPSTTALNYIPSLAVSTSGSFLYAVNFNESSLTIVDLTSGGVSGKAAGFARTGSPTKFEGNASFVGIRPGTPGVDFQGPAAFVATINLAQQDRTIPSVSMSIDAVQFDKN